MVSSAVAHRNTTIERLRTLAEAVEKVPHVDMANLPPRDLPGEIPAAVDGFTMTGFLEMEPSIGTVGDIAAVAACLWVTGSPMDALEKAIDALGLGVMESMALFAPMPGDVPDRPDMALEALTPQEAAHACLRLASHIEAVGEGFTRSLSLDPSALSAVLWR